LAPIFAILVFGHAINDFDEGRLVNFDHWLSLKVREKKRPGQWGVMVWPGRPGDKNKRLSLERRRLTPATIGPTPVLLPFSIHSADTGEGPVRLFRA
jgi:hypothetical protein